MERMKRWMKRLLALALVLTAVGAQAGGLTLWHTLEEMYREDFGALVKRFEESSGQSVAVEYQGRVAEVLKKVLAANIGSGEELPHVFPVHSNEIKNLARDGVIEPLDDLIKQAGLDLNGYYMLDTYQYDGKQYGLPWTITAISVFYNDTMAQQEGIAFPAAWEEMDAFVEKATVKNSDGTTARYALWIPGWDSYYFTWLFWNQGVITMDEQGHTAFHEQKAKDIVAKVKSWVDSGYVMWGYGSNGSSNMRSAFWDGAVFAILHTSSQYQNHKDNMLKKGWALGVAMPPKGDVTGTTEVFGMALTIPKKLKAEEKQKAFNLLAFLTSKDIDGEMAAFTGFLANHKQGLDTEKGKAWLAENAAMSSLYSRMGDMQSAVQMPGYQAMTDVMEDSLALIMLENAPLDATMDKMADDLVGIFEDNQ